VVFIDQTKCNNTAKRSFDISDKTKQLIWQLFEIRSNVVRKEHARYVSGLVICFIQIAHATINQACLFLLLPGEYNGVLKFHH
jgi:hypothetical protein